MITPGLLRAGASGAADATNLQRCRNVESLFFILGASGVIENIYPKCMQIVSNSLCNRT
jgi:hypothetical protein